MCCLFGILDYEHRLSSKNLAYITSVLSKECEARGTDATGIAYVHHGRVSVYKRPKPAHSMRFRIPNDSHVIMGHTRLTTQGNEKFNNNNHPFTGFTLNTPFALAHNGILHNDKQLRYSEKLPKTAIETDSYIAVQLIEKQKALDFDSLKYMAEKVEGSFSFTVLDKLNNLYFVKGDNPLCIYRFSRLGFYLYASTEEILRKAVFRLGLHDYTYESIKTTGGDILCIDRHGKVRRGHFDFKNCRAWDFSHRPYHGCFSERFDEEYWEELKFVAHHFGYNEDDIESLRLHGYSPEEVEEFLYCGDF